MRKLLPLWILLSFSNKFSCKPNKTQNTTKFVLPSSFLTGKKMSKQPGFYYDIGKKARDLLYKDYARQPPKHHHYQFLDWSFDLSFRMEEIVPGFRTVFRYILPDYRKVELQYVHDYFGVTAGIGLTANPLLNFSSVLGNSFVSLGTDLTFDTATRMLTKCNAGLSLSTALFDASLTLNGMGDNLNATCFHTINPLTRTAIAAELLHTFSRNETVFSVGTHHALFPPTLLKARVNSNGELGVLAQHELWPKLFVTLAGEVDAKAIFGFPKIGFSVAIRP